MPLQQGRGAFTSPVEKPHPYQVSGTFQSNLSARDNYRAIRNCATGITHTNTGLPSLSHLAAESPAENAMVVCKGKYGLSSKTENRSNAESRCAIRAYIIKGVAMSTAIAFEAKVATKTAMMYLERATPRCNAFDNF